MFLYGTHDDACEYANGSDDVYGAELFVQEDKGGDDAHDGFEIKKIANLCCGQGFQCFVVQEVAKG